MRGGKEICRDVVVLHIQSISCRCRSTRRNYRLVLDRRPAPRIGRSLAHHWLRSAETPVSACASSGLLSRPDVHPA
jgi:hypothetical protein